MTERQLQEAIEKAINLTENFWCFIVDVNLVPLRDKKTGKWRMIRNQATLGVPDICVQCENGNVLWLECKLPGRTQSEAQRRFQEDLWRAGGCVMVVHSVAEALEGLAAYAPFQAQADRRFRAMLKELNGRIDEKTNKKRITRGD